MQPVCEFDHDDPDVLGHRYDHSSQIFSLRVFGGLKLDLGDLGQTIDQQSNLLPKMMDEILTCYVSILDSIVQKPDDDGGSRPSSSH